jgi:membrane-associated phospholipid phosphatase
MSPFIHGQTTDSASPGAPRPDIRDTNLYEPSTDNPAAYGRKEVVNVLLDQKRIWLSPFHANRQTARWWLIFGAGTAALIASDHEISERLPNTGSAVRIDSDLSRTGQYYSVYPFAASLYFVGARLHNHKLSDTGALGVQALLDAAIVANVMKVVARRERPLDGDGGGHFETGGSSFPSGHTIEAWTLAAVVAKQYGNHKWVPFVSYAYATAVSVSRVAARQHFPSDVLASGAMGFFIGRYVVNNHNLHEGHFHNRAAWLRPSLSPYFSGGGIGAQLMWQPGRQ